MANFNEAFKFTVKNKNIFSTSDLQNDRDYKNVDNEMNKKYLSYQNKNHRYRENVDYNQK